MVLVQVPAARRIAQCSRNLATTNNGVHTSHSTEAGSSVERSLNFGIIKTTLLRLSAFAGSSKALIANRFSAKLVHRPVPDLGGPLQRSTAVQSFLHHQCIKLSRGFGITDQLNRRPPFSLRFKSKEEFIRGVAPLVSYGDFQSYIKWVVFQTGAV